MLAPAERHRLHFNLGAVCKRYAAIRLPMVRRRQQRSSQQHFYQGVSMTGRETHTLLPQLLTDQVDLPQPLHALVLSLRHIVYPLYAENAPLSNGPAWTLWGYFCTVVVHVILEHVECDFTRTLYLHGLQHCWSLPSLPRLRELWVLPSSAKMPIFVPLYHLYLVFCSIVNFLEENRNATILTLCVRVPSVMRCGRVKFSSPLLQVELGL